MHVLNDISSVKQERSSAQTKHTMVMRNTRLAHPFIPFILYNPKADGEDASQSTAANRLLSSSKGVIEYTSNTWPVLDETASKAAACNSAHTCTTYMSWTNTVLRGGCRNSSRSQLQRIRQGHAEPHFDFSSQTSCSSACRGSAWSRRRVRDRARAHSV